MTEKELTYRGCLNERIKGSVQEYRPCRDVLVEQYELPLPSYNSYGIREKTNERI